MRNIPIYVNGKDGLGSDVWNSIKNEVQNAVISTDTTLDPQGGPDTDLNMFAEAAAVYASCSDHYVDYGSVDAYILSRGSSIEVPNVYYDGMKITFYPINNNSGACTVNVAGLGEKDLKTVNGNPLPANTLVAGSLATFIYSNNLGYFKYDNKDPNLLYGGFETVPECNGDHSYAGLTTTMTVDVNTIGFGGALYIAADGNLEEADATSTSTMPCFCLACETGTGSKKVLLHGFMRDDSWNWTPGGKIYLSTSSGLLTQTEPDNSQIVGIATHADRIFFKRDFIITIIPTVSPINRGCFGGGHSTSNLNVIDYITIASTGNATDFGDMTVYRDDAAGCSNDGNNRGCFGGGGDPAYNVIDYITISSTGDATDFGDLTVARYNLSACSNGTNERGCFGGGYTGSERNEIDYITISNTGNAADFGDLTLARRYLAGCSNGTNDRGCFGGGSNVIDYITINSTGNATDFGDLTVARYGLAACSNGTNERGCFGGGDTGSNVIDYITISSTGNATDFGDLTVARYEFAGCSNGTNERGCFGGGRTSSNWNIIDYITINSIGNAIDFGDLSIGRDNTSACAG